MSKKKRPDRFVVGFAGTKHCVYGGARSANIFRKIGDLCWVDPMTITQAKRRVKNLIGAKAEIYELVEYTPPKKGKK